MLLVPRFVPVVAQLPMPLRLFQTLALCLPQPAQQTTSVPLIPHGVAVLVAAVLPTACPIGLMAFMVRVTVLMAPIVVDHPVAVMAEAPLVLVVVSPGFTPIHVDTRAPVMIEHQMAG